MGINEPNRIEIAGRIRPTSIDATRKRSIIDYRTEGIGRLFERTEIVQILLEFILIISPEILLTDNVT